MRHYGGYEDIPILAELYDQVPAYRDRADQDFYLGYCRAAGGPVLELGCGTGRILLPAAAAGCEMTGIDLSEHMLSRCRDKLTKLPDDVQQRVRLVRGNMVDFSLPEQFNLVTIPFRPFQHLVAVNDQLACLTNIIRRLAIGGKLVFDVFHVNLDYLNDPRYAEEKEEGNETELPDGRCLRRTHRTVRRHRAEQYFEAELIYYVTDREGKTTRFVQAFPFRYFFRYEIEHLLALTGFVVAEIYGNFDKSPLQDDSPEMIFVAEKRREKFS